MHLVRQSGGAVLRTCLPLLQHLLLLFLFYEQASQAVAAGGQAPVLKPDAK